jgi:hypothetical protein
MSVLRLAILASLTVALLYGDDWAKAFTVSGVPDLRIETDDGSVTVRTASDGKVSARLSTSGWKIGPGEVEVREFQSGGRVELIVRRPHRHFEFGGHNRSIRLEVEVPHRTNADIRTGDGAIDIRGVAGELRLRTGDGRIDGDALDGSLKADTGDGHVHIRGRLDNLNIHTGDGGIEADILPGSKMAMTWHVGTGDGGVTVRLPRDFGAEIDAHTGDGHISVDFPVTASFHERREHEVRGRINGGGFTFSIRTNDGSIHVKPL